MTIPLPTPPPPPPEDKNSEDMWMQNFWRPLMAVQYCAVCVFDFIIGPLLNGWYAVMTSHPYVQWDPLTLKATGFYHVAMATILGVASWTRGQEKIKRIELEHKDFEERLRVASDERTQLNDTLNRMAEAKKAE